MNNVKSIFSIKDLENLSGIKAHTIRIWEKRYGVLEPMRADTNIRLYDLESLQKLLNITLLHNHGYKISKISQFPADKIPQIVRDIVTDKSVKSHAINAFKMAMMNFDQTLFFSTYDNLLSKQTFKEIFYDVYMPLMEELGLLWQTDTISPAHEHFISYLIKQKLLINTEKLQVEQPTKTDKIFVLYLPPNEIHELGLMYLNYEFLLHGYKTIYLGESVPTSSLKDVYKYFENITFVSYVTVEPSKEYINAYIENLKKELLIDSNTNLWLIGKMVDEIDENLLNENISVYQSIKEMTYDM